MFSANALDADIARERARLIDSIAEISDGCKRTTAISMASEVRDTSHINIILTAHIADTADTDKTDRTSYRIDDGYLFLSVNFRVGCRPAGAQLSTVLAHRDRSHLFHLHIKWAIYKAIE